MTVNNTIVDGIEGQVQPNSAYNLIGTGGSGGLVNGVNNNQVGVTNMGLDPNGPQFNGGPTQTIALLPGSPALNAGSVALAVDENGSPLSYDQRGAGYPRVINGTVDIGAYEFTPLTQTIDFGPLASQSYGVAPITLSASATSSFPVNFTVLSGPATLSGDVLTVTGVGTIDVEASQPGNATYAAASPLDESFTVSPAALIITPTTGQSMVYGSAVPTLTYTASGFVNGDPASLLTGTLGTTATSTSVVGNYPFTLGFLTAGTNYALALAAKPPTFAVTPATLCVTANPETKVYGIADPVLTYAVSGFRSGDTASSVLTGSLTRTAGETVVGSPYAISRGTLAADANYTIAFTGSSLTVTPAPLAVTPTVGQSMVYGGTVPALTYSYTGLVNGDTSATFSGLLATTATSSSGVGGYPITQGTLIATGNYTVGTFNPGTLTITPATPTITWADPAHHHLRPGIERHADGCYGLLDGWWERGERAGKLHLQPGHRHRSECRQQSDTFSVLHTHRRLRLHTRHGHDLDQRQPTRHDRQPGSLNTRGCTWPIRHLHGHRGRWTAVRRTCRPARCSSRLTE